MDIPLWMWRYAEKVLKSHEFDSSHDLYHLVNVYTYAKDIIYHDYPDKILIEGLPERGRRAIYHAAFCHDLVDDKYVDTDLEMKALKQVFMENGYSDLEWKAVDYLIGNISFSKQRHPDFHPNPMYQTALEIVSDADKLDAYRPERVVAYQSTKAGSQKQEWIKTILVKRVLEYRDKWLKTDYALAISEPMHRALELYVAENYSDVGLLDY